MNSLYWRRSSGELAFCSAGPNVARGMAEHKEEEWLYGEADLIIPGATLEGEAAQALQYVPDEQLLAFARVKLRKFALLLHIVRCNGGVLPHARPEYMIDYAMYKELVLGKLLTPF
ncbi:Protein of unknown function [Gryllus bimaculatus]|nr:Protein of unknown function [Gryllus bimaculatus]